MQHYRNGVLQRHTHLFRTHKQAESTIINTSTIPSLSMPTSPAMGLHTRPSGSLLLVAAAWELTSLLTVARMKAGLHWIDRSISSIRGRGAAVEAAAAAPAAPARGNKHCCATDTQNDR